MTRDERLAWCKRRALEYLDRDDLQNAVASLISDLGRFDETQDVAETAIALFPVALLHVTQGDKASLRRWITEIN